HGGHRGVVHADNTQTQEDGRAPPGPGISPRGTTLRPERQPQRRERSGDGNGNRYEYQPGGILEPGGDVHSCHPGEVHAADGGAHRHRAAPEKATAPDAAPPQTKRRPATSVLTSAKATAAARIATSTDSATRSTR